MADDRDRNRGQEAEWEALKLYFETFKHFTTLATAVGLIMLAIGGNLEVPAGEIVNGLVAMGATLILSLFGMLATVTRAQSGSRARPGLFTLILAAMTAGSFLSGIWIFVELFYGLELVERLVKLLPF